MTIQFDRRATLEISNRIVGKKIEIKDLRVSFKIDKNNETNSNSAQISIYNLNPDNRARFGIPGNDVELFVGYAGVLGDDTLVKKLFSGNISRASTEKKGPDFITKIEAGDKEISIEELEFNKTYKSDAGKSIKDIIKDIAKKMKLTVNGENINAIDEEKKFKNAVTFSGKASTVMDDLVNKLGLKWNVQDGELHVRNKLDANIENAVLLSKETGLIAIPIKREEGMNFVALINTAIKPTVTVRIDSDQAAKDLSGDFIVTKAVYTGDTREGDWLVSCEAIKVKEAKKVEAETT